MEKVSQPYLDKVCRVTGRGIVALAGLICACAALRLIAFFYPFAFMDTSSPRLGAPVNLEPGYDLANRCPTQHFYVGSEMFLEVYLPEGREQAPIVQLKRTKGPALWTVMAMAEDPAGTYQDGARMVNLLRFDRVQKLDGDVIGVFGHVDWAMGLEGTWWKIGKDGALIGYWYSS